MFRNAISYASPRGERQRTCITFMAKTYIDQLTFERKQLDDALAAQTLIIQDHVTTATERTTDTLTRVVETCSDCYGQKSKWKKLIAKAKFANTLKASLTGTQSSWKNETVGLTGL